MDIFCFFMDVEQMVDFYFKIII